MRRRLVNRLSAVLEHIPIYSFQGPSRLATDAGVSRSAVSRLMNGRSSPSYEMVLKLTSALEVKLGRHLDPLELVALDGTFPTTYVCALCGCRGCLSSRFYDDDGSLRPAYRAIRPGRWRGTEGTARKEGA